MDHTGAVDYLVYVFPAVVLYSMACLYYSTHQLFRFPQDISLGITSMILSFFSFSGFRALDYLSRNKSVPADFDFLPSAPINVAIFAVVLFIIFKFLTEKCQYCPRKETAFWKENEKKVLSAVITGVLFCCYLFWVLCLYPGSVAADTQAQIYEFLGITQFTDQSPLWVTILYGLLYKAGSFIGDGNTGIFIGNVAQALLMAFAFSQSSILIGEKTNSKCLCFISAAIYAVLPMWGAAAQCLLKDSLHVSIFTLFYIFYIRMLGKENLSNKEFVWLLGLLLLVSFTRKGSFYIALLCAALLFFLLPHSRWNAQRTACVTVSLVAVYILVEAVVFPCFHIGKALSVENLSLPLQQVSLVYIQHGDELSSEEVEVIQNVIACDTIEDVFNHNLTDPIKKLYLDNDGNYTQDFLRLYLRLGFRYPQTYLNALVGNNWKYFYPLSPGYGSYRRYIAENSLGWRRVLNWDYCLKYYNFWCEHYPLKLFIGPGIYIWAVFLSAAVAFASQNKKKIGITAPILCFSIGLLLTPVNGEVRYAYPIIAVAPLVLILCLVDKKSGQYRDKKKPTELPDDSTCELNTVG